MSFAAESWAWSQGKTAPQRYLLVYLGWRTSRETGSAWPSMSTICAETKLDERTVRKALEGLIEAGCLTRAPRKTAAGRVTSNEYRLAAVQFDDTISAPTNIQDQTALSAPTNIQELPSPAPTILQGQKSSAPTNIQDQTALSAPTNIQENPLGSKTQEESKILPQPAFPWHDPIAPKPARTAPEDSFETFWKQYPHKVGKADARKAYKRALAHNNPETLIAHVMNYRFNPDPKFIMQASRWLNGERWNDVQQDALAFNDPRRVCPWTEDEGLDGLEGTAPFVVRYNDGRVRIWTGEVGHAD